MKRVPTFINHLRLPGVKKNQVGIHLDSVETFLWWGDRFLIRSSQVGYDTITNRFFLTQPNRPLHPSGPTHLKTVSFIHEGKINDVSAAKSFMTLWLDTLSAGNKSWFQLLTGTYVVPTDITSAQQQIYAQVFEELPGSWSAVKISELLPYLITHDTLPPSCGTMIYLTDEYTEINILSNNEVIKTRTVYVGVRDLKNAIDQVLREQYHLVTDAVTQTLIYQELAAFKDSTMDKRISIRGKDLTTSLPQNSIIELTHFRQVIEWWLTELVNEIQLTYSQLSTAELSVLGQDIALVGPGAHFHVLPTFLSDTFKVAVTAPPHPERSLIKVMPYVAPH